MSLFWMCKFSTLSILKYFAFEKKTFFYRQYNILFLCVCSHVILLELQIYFYLINYLAIDTNVVHYFYSSFIYNWLIIYFTFCIYSFFVHSFYLPFHIYSQFSTIWSVIFLLFIIYLSQPNCDFNNDLNAWATRGCLALIVTLNRFIAWSASTRNIAWK